MPVSTPTTRRVSPLAKELEDSGKSLVERCREQRERLEKMLADTTPLKTYSKSPIDSVSMTTFDSMGTGHLRWSEDIPVRAPDGSSKSSSTSPFLEETTIRIQPDHRAPRMKAAIDRNARCEHSNHSPYFRHPVAAEVVDDIFAAHKYEMQERAAEIERLRARISDLENGEGLMLKVGREVLNRFRALRLDNDELSNQLRNCVNVIGGHETMISRLMVERSTALKEVECWRNELAAESQESVAEQ